MFSTSSYLLKDKACLPSADCELLGSPTPSGSILCEEGRCFLAVNLMGFRIAIKISLSMLVRDADEYVL